MMGIQALNVVHYFDALYAFPSIYECDIEDLRHEVHQMNRILEKKITSGEQMPSNIVELTKITNLHTV
jgi:hypothetical protein